jgi:hypothetical protein
MSHRALCVPVTQLFTSLASCLATGNLLECDLKENRQMTYSSREYILKPTMKHSDKRLKSDVLEDSHLRHVPLCLSLFTISTIPISTM